MVLRISFKLLALCTGELLFLEWLGLTLKIIFKKGCLEILWKASSGILSPEFLDVVI
jgi:hypothetical protein